MTTATAALGAAGTAPSITHKGKTYSIGSMTVKVFTELERYLIDRKVDNRSATLATMVKQGLLTNDQAVEKIEKYSDELVRSGDYAFGSENMMLVLFGKKTAPTPEEFQKEMDTTPEEAASKVTNMDRANLLAKLKFFSLLLNCELDEMMEIFSEKSIELMGKIKMVLAESLPAPK